MGLAIYLSAKTQSNFFGESFRFARHPQFDGWVRGLMTPGDSILSSYGYANDCFKFSRETGGITFLDGGNSHPANFWEVLIEEHRRWDCPFPPVAGHHFERSMAMMEDVDYVFAPSSFVASSFLERGFIPEQILNLPYPVDFTNFSPSGTKRDKRRPLTLICTGSLSLRKGTPYLLEAFRIVRRSVPDARLLLTRVITDSVKTILQNNSDLPIDWAPSLPHRYLADRLRGADLFVIPSLEEGLVRSALEALACGLPAIVTPNSGVNDFIIEGENGSVVPIRDPQKTADAILWWWEKIGSGAYSPDKPLLDYDKLGFSAFALQFTKHLKRLAPETTKESPLEVVSSPPEIEPDTSKTSGQLVSRKQLRDKRKTICFVIGAGRSGTTFLGSILNGAEGVFTVGELHTILWNGYHGDFCSCQKPLFECEFWDDVFNRADIPWNEAHLNELSRIVSGVIRYKNLPALLRGVRAGYHVDAKFADYLELSERIYDATLEKTGAHTLIDLSKHPLIAMSMATSKRYRYKFIQLIRDPRAVAYSWTKVKRVHHIPSLSDVVLDSIDSPRATMLWNTENLLSEVTSLFPGDYLKVRYEDIVLAPDIWMSRICDFIGVPPIQPVGELTYRRVAGHMLAGNLNRFEGKDVKISLDDKWRGDLGSSTYLGVTMASLPLLLRYRYSILRKSPFQHFRS